jgi:hypothetical protein
MHAALLHSRADGADRLLLIAIASFANSANGKCFPSIETLAALLRVDVRSVQRGIARLKGMGDLEVLDGGGRGRANNYRLTLNPDAGATLFGIKTPESTPGFTRQKPRRERQQTPASTSPNPDVGVTPTEENQERTEKSALRRTRDTLPRVTHQPVPVDAIINMFHKHMTELPRVKVLDSKKRQTLIAAFWTFALKRSCNGHEPERENALNWIDRFFAKAQRLDFFAGRRLGGPGHEGWRPDFDHLISERARIKIIEAVEHQLADDQAEARV